MDRISPSQRSRLMSRVRSKDTRPEMTVRKLVFSMGYRYRLHDKKLPGKPDLVFAGRRKVIFVHGCFWHCHKGCKKARAPKSRRDYWLPKLRANRNRDMSAQAALEAAGWRSLVLWSCELEGSNLRTRIRRFLGPTGTRP